MLDAAARGRIDLARVRQHWPDILRMVASVHSGAVSASDLMRMLQHGGNPTRLGQALAHLGRVFKTLHVLSYVDAESYRRAIKRMRNLQEGRHGQCVRLRASLPRRAGRQGADGVMIDNLVRSAVGVSSAIDPGASSGVR